MVAASEDTVRPTKRCLEDLGLRFPPYTELLSKMSHALVQRAQKVPQQEAAALSNEISRVRFWEARLQQRPAGSALALSGSFGNLLADRAPAGSPVAGLLMGCRARVGVST